jgi:DNA-binding transcriptional LysR family regulator
MEKAMKEQVKEEVVIDSKRLFYFSKVFERGSLNAVAASLDMAQAGIGRQIQLLEQELGMLLFERGTRGRGMVPGGQGRGMVPTDAARLVYDFYHQYRDQKEKLMVALAEMRQMKRGNIRIAMFVTYVSALMEEVLNDFQCEHPSLNIEIQEIDSSPQVITKVLEDEAHIGITYGYPDNPDICCRARAVLPLTMLVNKCHPLVHRKSSNLTEIISYPFILPPPSYAIGKIIRSVERSENIQLTPAFISDSNIARKQAAIAGRGGALMSAFAARQEIQAGQLIPVAIDHPAFASMKACLIVRRGRLLSPAANQLLRLIAGRFSIFKHHTFDPFSTKTSSSGAITSLPSLR